MRGAAFNLLGAAVPAALAVLTVPLVVRYLGQEDYGLLMLVTSIMGYFALIDINITAASTKFVAQHRAQGAHRQVNQTASFGLLIYLVIGLIGGAALWIFAKPLATEVFKVSPARQADAVRALQWGALGFLIGQVQIYLQSLPGALGRYDLAGSVEASFGVLVPLLTVVLLMLGGGLVELIWLRVALSSVQALGVLAWLIRRMKLRWARPDGDTRRVMLSFSAFAFLSRFAALTYSHCDKLIIGAVVGAGPLTLFAVPTMLVNRIMALLFRLAAVMFPHASQLAAQDRMAELQTAYFTAARYLCFLNGATALLLAVLAPAILTVWMGPQFATTSATILTLMALAQWLDSLTHVPSLVNDGLGHPKVSGLFAVARALLGLALIATGVMQAGIAGAAWAHLAAALVMGAAFIGYVHGRSLPFSLRKWLLHAALKPTTALLPGVALGWLLRGWAVQGWVPLILSAFAMSLAYAMSAWWLVLDPPHRATVRARLIGIVSSKKP
jgi:O-antigen/teichoic acid export membrane protein